MNQTEYLSRIGIKENGLEPTEETLRLLQRQHLLTAPFENLDIHWKRPTKTGEKTETPIESNEEFDNILLTEFEIESRQYLSKTN